MDTLEMTAEELTRLKAELNELESDGRSQIAARIKTAREWGDLKENGEYHAALIEELAALEGDGRRAIAERIKTAREWGDLKENSEYHDAKND